MKKISIRNLNCKKGRVPPESAAVIQSIFNRAGEYSKYYFGHSQNGHEVSEFFGFQPNPLVNEFTAYEILLEERVSISIGLIAVTYFPEIRQSYISLVLVDRRYRGLGIGSKAVKLLESMLEFESQYVSVKVNIAQQKAMDFWREQGFVAESNIPLSMSTVFTPTENHVRLVKRTSHPHAEAIIRLSEPAIPGNQSHSQTH